MTGGPGTPGRLKLGYKSQPRICCCHSVSFNQQDMLPNSTKVGCQQSESATCGEHCHVSDGMYT